MSKAQYYWLFTLSDVRFGFEELHFQCSIIVIGEVINK